jgi:hypothetical protein
MRVVLETRGLPRLRGGGGSRAKLVSDAGTGNFLKISGKTGFWREKSDRPFEIRQLSQAVAAAPGHFPVILQNRQLKRKTGIENRQHQAFATT